MLTVREIREKLDLRLVAGEAGLEKTITGGYVGDLLSCVMAGAGRGNVWITVQGHPNVVAVAVLVDIAAVVIAEGRRVEEVTREKANQEGVPLLVTGRTSFQVVSALSALGINGTEC